MHESCTSEGVTKVTLLAVSSDEASEPVIGKANCRDLTSIAAVLQACLTEAGDHLCRENRSIVRIWAREDVRMVQEHKMHAVNDAFMNTHFDTTLNIDKKIVLMVDAILMQIVCLTLFVSVIIR